jgi:hypothetical protein
LRTKILRSNLIRPSLFNPVLLWSDVALKTAEMLMSSGQVIGTRLDRIARAGPNPSARDRREFALMGSEKISAASKSAMAVASRLQSANYELMMRAWRQWFASLGAMNSLAASRSFGQALSRQKRLSDALARSGRTQARISSDTARLASAALKPVHSASTANAKRLARGKTRSAARR